MPNPAHAQFISRESPDARDETKALSLVRARQLMNLPSGESILHYRDRAILKILHRARQARHFVELPRQNPAMPRYDVSF